MSGAALGGHAVKMIGWGEENGTPYWLIANSWNSDWGDHGMCKYNTSKESCNFLYRLTNPSNAWILVHSKK